MNKEKKLIGNHNISPLVDELLLISAKTFSYIGGVYVYCRKHDLDKYLSLGELYGLNCHYEQKDDIFYIVHLDFFKNDTDNNETTKRG